MERTSSEVGDVMDTLVVDPLCSMTAAGSTVLISAASSSGADDGMSRLANGASSAPSERRHGTMSKLISTSFSARAAAGAGGGRPDASGRGMAVARIDADVTRRASACAQRRGEGDAILMTMSVTLSSESHQIWEANYVYFRKRAPSFFSTEAS